MFKEDQVCNPDQAKILCELGILQDSVWYWNKHDDGTWHLHHNKYSFEVCSAFTGMELGLMLPLCMLSTTTYIAPYFMEQAGKLMYHVEGKLCTGIPNKNTSTVSYSAYTGALTEAQARAQMLIHLLKMEIYPFQYFNKLLYNSKEKD